LDVAPLWTGTITCQLIDARSQPAWPLGVVLRRDVVTFWLGERNLAMVDRDLLRHWAHTGARPLERHDLILSRVGAWMAFIIDAEPPVWLNPADATRFRALL
jgi:hypothetical protein